MNNSGLEDRMEARPQKHKSMCFKLKNRDHHLFCKHIYQRRVLLVQHSGKDRAAYPHIAILRRDVPRHRKKTLCRPFWIWVVPAMIWILGSYV